VIETILFDLGGVFIEVDLQPAISVFARYIGKISEKEIYNFLYHSEWTRRFEKGLVDPQTFYQHLREEWQADFSFAFFKTTWNRLFTPIQPMVDLLPELKKSFRLICVSNTNVLHIEYLKNRIPLFHYFDHLVFSYEVGYSKPEPEIYLEALHRAQSRPRACLFVDDLLLNVQAAQKLGMETIHFKTYDVFVNELRKRELIQPLNGGNNESPSF
jgi:putative hydrolase of the HAD superfamily